MNARPMLYDVLGRNFLLTRAARPDIADRSSHFDQCTRPMLYVVCMLYTQPAVCISAISYAHGRPAQYTADRVRVTLKLTLSLHSTLLPLYWSLSVAFSTLEGGGGNPSLYVKLSN